MEEKTSTKVILYGNNKHAWLVFWTGLKIQYLRELISTISQTQAIRSRGGGRGGQGWLWSPYFFEYFLYSISNMILSSFL
jgi:hypothetical protein